MAWRRQADGEKYIEADNGFGWTREKESGKYRTTIFGITYELERRGGLHEDVGWYLYSIKGSTHFFGEYCDRRLLNAIDEASKLIVQTGLRGEGYEVAEA